ncbi:MAG: FAD-dependent monooxygenase [Candidatus Aenigmarchaeota archaeon]|nr:FAD-dependent monooxygenase [Candidatus Aenigmarchaeota archaeon]
MKNEYNVIIIGAGPAGLKCAEGLKNSGLSVLLIEKNKIIGPKVCAGGLTNLDAHFDIPSNKTRVFEKAKMYVVKRKYDIKLSTPIKIIDRYDLGQYMLNKLKDSKNITILKETLVKSIEKNRIKTSKGIFHFKYLVGADGASSVVRKYIGLENKIYMGIQYIIPEMCDEFIGFINPKLISSGYGWIFPHKKFTSAGIFFNPKLVSVADARIQLNNFLDDYGLDYSNARYEGGPVNCLFKGIQFDNIFLVGDAAGLTSANLGEGISYALTSGEEVARKIINPDYKIVELNRLLKIKKLQENVLYLFDRLPFLQEPLFRIFFSLFKKTWFQSHYFYLSQITPASR